MEFVDPIIANNGCTLSVTLVLSSNANVLKSPQISQFGRKSLKIYHMF